MGNKRDLARVSRGQTGISAVVIAMPVGVDDKSERLVRQSSNLRGEGRPLAGVARYLELARELRRARYQLTIDAQCNLRSSLWSPAG